MIIIVLIVLMVLLYNFKWQEGFKPSSRHRQCCNVCMKSLDNQEKNTRLYYDKFRQLQDDLSNTQVQLLHTQKILDNYKRKYVMCSRKLTKKPIIAKYNQTYGVVPNSITGNGIETYY